MDPQPFKSGIVGVLEGSVLAVGGLHLTVTHQPKSLSSFQSGVPAQSQDFLLRIIQGIS